MERHFDQDLQELKNSLLRMGSLVEAAISGSVEALKRLDAHEAQRIICDDKKIDALENEVDEQCLELLALHQPMASDLRFIAMVMKITTDLERMADLAVDIAQRVRELSQRPLLKPLIDIPKLTRLARQMTRDAIDAFVNRDVDLAGKVIMLEREADRLRNAVQEELINDYMLRDASVASRAVSLLLIARHLERICDHSTNIAEDVIYMINAKVVRHHPDRLKER